jgi:predicted transglutaminase-like cysteine proteinase
VKLTEKAWVTMRQVHSEVMTAFIWTADKDQYGVRDHWVRPTPDAAGYMRGDCEDFAIECDHRLREAGIPAKAMCYYLCNTEKNGAHLVLGVHTDAGTFMLDNRQQWPMDASELDDLGYHNWARPQPGHPITDAWQTIEFGQGAA